VSAPTLDRPANDVSADPNIGTFEKLTGGAFLAGDALQPRRMRLRTLVTLRWLAILGQLTAVLIVHVVLGYALPLLWCLGLIGAKALLNVVIQMRFAPTRRLSEKESALAFSVDLLQLAGLLYLTGGLQNPFALLFLAPVTISATILRVRTTVMLGALAFACISFLAVFHEPLPWDPEQPPFDLPALYVGGVWLALGLGLVFTAAFALRVSQETSRMQAAVEATQSVLAREQRLAALGGLAAAAAHELGTPLATIALVAKELERDVPEDSPLKDDVALLRDQTARCKDILSRLGREPGGREDHHSVRRFGALLDEIVEPHRGLGVAVEIHMLPGSNQDRSEPEVLRRAEIVYGLGNIVENAVDFARAKVTITAGWDAERLSVRVADDGPGFSADIIDRLGEPYVTTRPRRAGSQANGAMAGDIDEHEGMGLGFFIAKTLLERTGARMHVANSPGGRSPGERGGAVVEVVWPRADLTPRTAFDA